MLQGAGSRRGLHGGGPWGRAGALRGSTAIRSSSCQDAAGAILSCSGGFQACSCAGRVDQGVASAGDAHTCCGPAARKAFAWVFRCGGPVLRRPPSRHCVIGCRAPTASHGRHHTAPRGSPICGPGRLAGCARVVVPDGRAEVHLGCGQPPLANGCRRSLYMWGATDAAPSAAPPSPRQLANPCVAPCRR